MPHRNTVLRKYSILPFLGLSLLALVVPWLAHAGVVHVSVGFELPVPVTVVPAPVPVVVAPAPVVVQRPPVVIERLSFLSAAGKGNILGGNARKVLRFRGKGALEPAGVTPAAAAATP